MAGAYLLRDVLADAPPAQPTTTMAAPSMIFANPMESSGGGLLVVTGTFTAIAGLVVAARIYVRALMINSLGPDDYVMVFAMLCSAAVLGLVVVEVDRGLGLHITNPKLIENLTGLLHVEFYQGSIIVLGISAAKISVGFFLLRLVQGKWYKRILYGWIVFLVFFTIASVLTIVFRCNPISAAWDLALQFDPNTKCFSVNAFRAAGLANGSINIVTDFVFAFLPIPLVIPLQINLRTKVVLICILSLGYFACVSSIVKEVLLSRFFNNPDPFFDVSFNVWNDIELNIGIIAACLPTLRPIFAWLFVTAKTINASVHFPTTRRRNTHTVDEENIKLSEVPSHTETISSTGKDGYHISVVGGGAGGAVAGTSSGPGPLNSNKPKRMSLNLGREYIRPKGKLGASFGERDRSEDSWNGGAGGVGDKEMESSWGGIMRTTEVYVTR